MKTKFFIAASVMFSIALVAFASSVWHAKDKGVKIKFEFPAQKVAGTMGGMELEMTWDENNLPACVVNASIDVNTLHTDDTGTDEQLLSEMFFDVANYKEITYKSLRISKDGAGGYIASGILQVKNKTHDLDFPFLFDQTGNDGSIKGNFTFHASDYGLYPKPPAGKENKDKITITLSVPVKKQ